jgi:hypothetical protein
MKTKTIFIPHSALVPSEMRKRGWVLVNNILLTKLGDFQKTEMSREGVTFERLTCEAH